MAGGGKYNPHKITCSSRILPFDTIIHLTYTNHDLYCPITDRGPYVKGRAFDLSKEAAKKLGIDKLGVAYVTQQKINP